MLLILFGCRYLLVANFEPKNWLLRFCRSFSPVLSQASPLRPICPLAPQWQVRGNSEPDMCIGFCLLGRSARMTQNDAPTLCLLFNFLRSKDQCGSHTSNKGVLSQMILGQNGLNKHGFSVKLFMSFKLMYLIVANFVWLQVPTLC